MEKLIRILVFLFIITANNTIFSQTAFVSRYITDAGEIPTGIVQIGNDYFIGLQYNYEQITFFRYAKLLKMDSGGKIRSEIIFPVVDDCYSDIDRIIQLNTTEFLTIGGCKQNGDSNADLWIMKIDTALNILWDKKYKTNRYSTTNISVVENHEGNLLIGSSLTTGNPNHIHSLLFLEITKNGDSLQSKYFTNGYPSSTDIQSMIWIQGQYKAFVEGYGAYTNNNCFSQILQLDVNLNLIEVRPTPYLIERYLTAKRIDSINYFLTGNAYSSPTHYDVGIAKLSHTEDSIAFNHAGKPGTAVDFSGWVKCMSVANINSIYTGGTGFDNGDFYNCYITNKVLMLSNYDSLLNCRWTRFYGSDTACYTMSTLEATSDGGCIMGGMFYTPSRPENLLDAVIIKVDSLGLFTDIPENTYVHVHEAIVYPNPGEDYFTVQSGPQINGAVFRMYDVSGNMIKETILSTTLEQINAGCLPAGTYPWQIIYKGKKVEQGKWVRQ